ncbi:MAG: MBOAT family protein [Candidatus Omnitrophica bacterium]|nr:MBOAT family protein [Candidatus Omnitrophota bacterium]
MNHKWQNLFLLIASYFFYMWWDWRFAGLLLISTAIDFFCGLKIGECKEQKKRKKYLLFSVITNLSILGIFKYFNFFIEKFNRILSFFGIGDYETCLYIILPLGISFYTFQTLSYTIDIYRGSCKPVKKFSDYALYVSFFPQLLAGPIERASHLLPQIQAKRHVSWEHIKRGSYLIYWGLFKKIFIADNCRAIVEYALANSAKEGSGGIILVSLYAFAFCMYCDISGYTDIARGVAQYMGFDLLINFRLPYFAKNISEFWRKWHMSMTYWFRDYVYFPVLVKTKGNAYISSFIVMCCISIWHELSLNSILRGIYFGLVIAAYHIIKKRWLKVKKEKKRRLSGLLNNFFSRLMTFHIVCFGWMFFYTKSLKEIIILMRNVFFNFEIGIFITNFRWLFQYIGVLLLVQTLHAIKKDEFIVLKINILIQIVLYWFMFWAIFGDIGNVRRPFIYFRI